MTPCSSACSCSMRATSSGVRRTDLSAVRGPGMGGGKQVTRGPPAGDSGEGSIAPVAQHPRPQLGEQLRQCPQANTDLPPLFSGISVTACAGVIQPASPRHSESLHSLPRPRPQLFGSPKPDDPMDHATRCTQRKHMAQRHLRVITGADARQRLPRRRARRVGVRGRRDRSAATAAFR